MEDIENSPEFQALVIAATAKPERSMGDSIIPAEAPQWKEVLRLAKTLLDQAPNQLALHVYLIKAEACVNGFAGFRDALLETVKMLQEQWDDMYPAPDLDDPDDMYYARVNLISEFSEQPDFLDSLYRLPLVQVRAIGEFSTRDLDICAGTVVGSSEDQARVQEGLVKGAFAESEPGKLQEVSDALNALPDLLRTLKTVFAEKTDQPAVLSTDQLEKRIDVCRQRFSDYATEHLVATAVVEPLESLSDSVSDGVALAESVERASSGVLTDREMVLASFDAILLYYQTHEPSSPVRVMTFGAREFVGKSFFEVLQAMAQTHRDDLSAMLTQLRNQPLTSLLSDSYARYLSGEVLPDLQPPTTVTESQMPEVIPNDDSLLAEDGSQSVQTSGNSHRAVVIDSRQGVINALQDIETYYSNAEPASPIPLIVSDIRKQVSKGFMDLIEEFSSRAAAMQGGSDDG